MRRVMRVKGFMAADVLLALMVVVILTVALTVAATRQRKSSERLAETRAAARLAEATMLALQTSQQPPTPPAGAKVHIEPLEAAGELPAGTTWANVTVVLNGHTSALTGVVRRDALKVEAP